MCYEKEEINLIKTLFVITISLAILTLQLVHFIQAESFNKVNVTKYLGRAQWSYNRMILQWRETSYIALDFFLL